MSIGEADRCELPDTIIGMGEAGKKIVYRYLNTDWILEEALEPRGDEKNPDFNAFIIDTATSEKGEDVAKCADLEESIISLCNEEYGRPKTQVHTKVEYVNPLDETANSKYVSKVGLTAQSTVESIARAGDERFDAWWLEDDKDGHLLANDYKDGVSRRRGLSKALYHASQVGDESVDKVIDEAEGGDDVAIVVGLGGGTGSGMFLDIARSIEGAKVTLFAVIPGTGEDDRKRANAYSALSELEYLAIQNENPFENVVLLPFGPARKLPKLKPFYDATVQTIAAKTAGDEATDDPFNEAKPSGPPAYAPFTVAVPQILRYSVGDEIDTRQEILEFLEDKQSELEEELAAYESIESYIFDEFDGEPIANALDRAQQGTIPTYDEFRLEREEINRLDERFEALRSFVNLDVFDFLNFDAPSEWHERLNEVHREVENNIEYRDQEFSDSERRERLLTSVSRIVEKDVKEPVEQKWTNSNDQLLADVVRREIKAIHARANLLRAARVSESSKVERGITTALDQKLGSVAGDAVRSEESELDRKIRDIDHNVDVLERYLEEEDFEQLIDDEQNDLRTSIEDDVETILHIDDERDRIRELLAKLEDEIRSAVKRIERPQRPSDVPENPFQFDGIHELNDLLAEADVDGINVREIEENLQQAARAHETWLKANDVGVLGKLRDKHEEYRNEYGIYLDEIDGNLFEVTPNRAEYILDTDFGLSFTGEARYEDRIQDVDERRETLVRNVVEQVRESLLSLPVDHQMFREDVEDDWKGEVPRLDWQIDVDEVVEEIRSTFEDDVKDDSPQTILDELFQNGQRFGDSGVVYEAIRGAVVEPLEENRDELQSQKEQLETERDRFMRLRRIIEEEANDFEFDPIEDVVSDGNQSFETERNYTYIRQLSSPEGTSLDRYADIDDAGFWSADTEEGNSQRDSINSALLNAGETLRRSDRRLNLQHLELNVTDTEAAKGSPFYEGHFVASIFMSPCFDVNEDSLSGPPFDDIREKITNSIFLQSDANGYYSEKFPYGGEWDISMVTFVGGVFLDNIRAVSMQENGYKAAYEAQREKMMEDIRIRHAHGLDGLDNTISDDGYGGYVWRDQLLSLNEGSPERDWFAGNSNDPDEILERLLDDEYIVTEQFESTVDLAMSEVTDT